MYQATSAAASAPAFPAQEAAYLAIKQKPRDKAEKQRLEQVSYAALCKAGQQLHRAEVLLRRAEQVLERAVNQSFGKWDSETILRGLEVRVWSAQRRRERLEARVDLLCAELGIALPLPPVAQEPENTSIIT